MKNFEIPQNEIDTLGTLQELLDYNEIDSQEEGFMESDEYPFPQVFKFQALAIRTLLSNPEYKFPPIENLKHIFSEEFDGEATPTIYNTLHDLENLGDPEITIGLPHNYTNFYYIKINGNAAIYYEGSDGNSSTNFSFFGVIL